MQTQFLHSYHAPLVSLCANSLFMEAGLEEDTRLVKALCEWTHLAPSNLAERAGLAATTLTRPFKGAAATRISRLTLQKLREAVPDFPEWRDTEVLPVATADPFQDKYGSRELPRIPVVGSAIGAESFDPSQHIELTELDLSEVLDRVDRPASLANDARAYALTIVGDSMWPRFRPGRRVIVSPKAPVSIGDDVIVQLKSGRGGSDRITTALIKELVRRSASFIELRQFNPDITFRVPSDQLVSMHKVIGEIY